MTDLPPYPGMPLWAKVFAVVTILVIILFVILLITRGPDRGHGPGRRTNPADADIQMVPSAIVAGTVTLDTTAITASLFQRIGTEATPRQGRPC